MINVNAFSGAWPAKRHFTFKVRVQSEKLLIRFNFTSMFNIHLTETDGFYSNVSIIPFL